MPESLLQTKFYIPPVRTDLVSRPRLIDQLERALHQGHKLALISAPAGFGKTTLVAEWVGANNEGGKLKGQDGTSQPSTVAWLSLDEGDNDLARFLDYFIGALDQGTGEEMAIGRGALGMLRTPQRPPVEDILTSLINELSVMPVRTILVLDDYHVIEAAAIEEALAFLIEHLPRQLHLVIATREDPHLPLARLRARGQLTELRAADLRFSNSEAAEFLNQSMGLNLKEQDIATLEVSTEGWIAGLQLAAISMQGRKDASAIVKSFSGGHRYVLDYLVEEVLERQPGDIQDFLLQTAILNRLTGDLCDAVIGRSNGAANSQITLENLENANLFIVRLDEERSWYRYHHLFADLLRRRLGQTKPELAQQLHRRASTWYQVNGYVDEAINHALKGGDYQAAEQLIAENADDWWQLGQHGKLRRWLEALPEELLCSNPHLCVLQAWDLFTNGQQEAAERILQAAEQSLADRPDQGQLGDAEAKKIQGRVATVRAFLAIYRGDVPATYRYSNEALEYLPEQDLSWRATAIVGLGDAYSFFGELPTAYKVRTESVQASEAAGNVYTTLMAAMKRAITMRQLGMLDEATAFCGQQLALAQQNGLSQTVVAGWLHAIWGETLAELNDLDGARNHAEQSYELIRRGRDLAMVGWSHLCLIRVHYSLGDPNRAVGVIHNLEEIARDHFVPPWVAIRVAAWQARIWLALGDVDAAERWTSDRGLDAGREIAYLDEIPYMVLVRVLIARDQPDEAITLLEQLLQSSESRGFVSRILELLVLQAKAYQAKDDLDQAMSAMARALTLARSKGYVRTIVDEGQVVGRLLSEAVLRGLEAEFARGLLAAIQSAEPAQSSTPAQAVDQSVLFEPLSDRELEVLELIAQGLTNSEIASRLYLSLNTIKVHTRNIYAKLDAHSRTQAVAKARVLGLLPTA